MKVSGFLAGLVTGAVGATVGLLGYGEWRGREIQPVHDVAAPDASSPRTPRKKRAAVGNPSAPRSTLTAADLKTTSRGDDLSRPETLRMDLTDDNPGGAELTQDDIDARFRAREGAILDCIANARPDPETLVPGLVTIEFRIQRAGTVGGVRVVAPAVLHQGGLLPCVRGIVAKLRFPSSGSSQTVSYPFALR